MGERRAVPRLRVLVSDERGRAIGGTTLGGWLAGVAPSRARGVVGVVLARDATVHTLNREYRGRDETTDVLSFAMDAPRAGGARRTTRTAEPPYLGDVVIARGVARRQARAAGHGDDAELRVLALHGLLHLLGYDHHGSAGRTMARVERRLRARGGLRAGLIERARGRNGSDR